ncbi:MAG: hypothetical protein ABIH42_01035 [Planctomycetota bacterium]
MRSVTIFALLLFVTLGIACVGLPSVPPQGYTTKYILDEEIPIPPGGYQYLESISFTYIAPASSSTRIAELHLVGDTRVDEVADFYEKQLKLHDYNLVLRDNSTAAYKTTLLFKHQRENEEVKIEVERGETLVHIKIMVYPT